MSRDQKPKAVKAVTMEGGAASADGGLPGTEEQAEDTAQHGAADSAPAQGGAFPLVPSLLFLIGCIIGGAALTAVPHYKPEVAALLYGAQH